MNPGLPGTGIGGLFYILVALLMPLCEIRRRLKGEAPGRGTLVAKQFAIALGVVAATTGVFWDWTRCSRSTRSRRTSRAWTP